MEEWRKIGNYDYEASNYGDIRNIKTGRVLKQRMCKHGYMHVDIQVEKKGVTFNVHRLIIEAFYGLKEKPFEVDHIDRIKNNNNISNLRWVTRNENLENRKFGLTSRNKILEIIKMYENGKTIEEIYLSQLK
jgi:hypothetical protein